MTTLTTIPTQYTVLPYVQVRTKAVFSLESEGFLFDKTKRNLSGGQQPPAVAPHVRRRATRAPAHRGRCALRGAVWVRGDVESNPRDVEDAVPYGVLVCEPPRIAALPNATAHVRRRGTSPAPSGIERHYIAIFAGVISSSVRQPVMIITFSNSARLALA